MGILPNIFNKKPTEEELKKIILDEKKSRDKKKTKTKSQKTTEPPAVTTVKNATDLHTITFYGQPLRRVLFEKKWYFFLEDIVGLSGTFRLPEFLTSLRRDEEYKNGADTHISVLTVMMNSKEHKIECISYDDFTWLLPILRKKERSYPGPFPAWLAANSIPA